MNTLKQRMTPENQRIAIAEACGFKEGDPRFEYAKMNRVWWKKHPMNGNTFYLEKDLPDYLNDLNAMHEAEETLTREQLVDYCNFQLRASTGEGCVTEYKMIRAAASQRAEAFLRAVNKWNDKL